MLHTPKHFRVPCLFLSLHFLSITRFSDPNIKPSFSLGKNFLRATCELPKQIKKQLSLWVSIRFSHRHVWKKICNYLKLWNKLQRTDDRVFLHWLPELAFLLAVLFHDYCKIQFLSYENASNLHSTHQITLEISTSCPGLYLIQKRYPNTASELSS